MVWSLSLRLTGWANKNYPLVIVSWLEDCTTPIIVAFCAYPMRWFGSLARFFQCVNHSRTRIPWTYQLIALLFFFPCFQVSDFFFKVAYTLNHRKLLRLGRECARLGGQNRVLEINNLSLDLGERLEMKKTLCDITSGLEAKNRALKHSHINHD